MSAVNKLFISWNTIICVAVSYQMATSGCDITISAFRMIQLLGRGTADNNCSWHLGPILYNEIIN